MLDRYIVQRIMNNGEVENQSYLDFCQAQRAYKFLVDNGGKPDKSIALMEIHTPYKAELICSRKF